VRKPERPKSILEQVAEQEARRKDAEKSNSIMSSFFSIILILFAIVVVGGGIAVYQYMKPTEEEIAAKEEKRKEQRMKNSLAVDCGNLIQKKLNYPSTYSVKYSEAREIDGIMYVHIAFTAKNALGAELPQEAQCVTTEDGLMLIGIKNR